MSVHVFDMTRSSSVSPVQVSPLISRMIEQENPNLSYELRIILVDDDYIHSLNRQYLHHDYPTDVISFPLESDENNLEGEVYVSVERADQQAKEYGIPFEEEIWRLIIHGVLHLLGYDDQTEEDKKQMSKKEDFYLQKLQVTERKIV